MSSSIESQTGEAAATCGNYGQIKVWEQDTEEQQTPATWKTIRDVSSILKPCQLRIVLAPLDLHTPETMSTLAKLYNALAIPGEFAYEREISVCHSFGTRTDLNGFCAWFHFLCKNVPIGLNSKGTPVIASYQKTAHNSFPQADYSYLRAGLFLRKHAIGGGLTLVCFGASPKVREALEKFVQSKSHHVASAEPYALFDIVIQVLFKDVDQYVWNMADVFGPLEQQILLHAYSKRANSSGTAMPFTDLHNISKHAIYLSEAIASQLLLIDEILSRMKPDIQTPSIPQEQQSVRDSLEYRKTLFQSTQLRLGSLQHRIDNIIALSFNLVTQQDSITMIADSKRMVADSSTMKAIAALTMLFLPATAVATIMGNSLFEGGEVTSQFYAMWYVVVPLTLAVFVIAYLWMRWMMPRSDNPGEHTAGGEHAV